MSKFEVLSFKSFGAIIDQSATHRHAQTDRQTDTQTHTHRTKTVSPPITLFAWRR